MRKTMKKLTAYEKNCIEWDKEDAEIEVLLMGFDKPFNYDYTIPDALKVNGMVKKSLEILKLPKYMKNKIRNSVWATNRDDYSKLEFYINTNETRMGQEWFYEHGNLYRWREGEKEKAIKRINKYIPKKDMKYYKMVQDYLRENAKKYGDYE